MTSNKHAYGFYYNYQLFMHSKYYLEYHQMRKDKEYDPEEIFGLIKEKITEVFSNEKRSL